MTLLLYPGFHKTGTTLMQTRVLPGLGLNYLGRYYGADQEFQLDYRDAIEGHLEGLAQGKARVPALTRLLTELIQDGTVHVLATENLLRPASTGDFLEAVTAAAATAPAGRIAVLLTVRRQIDLMVSRYLHDLNVKHPTMARHNIVGRAFRRIWRWGPPYSLSSAVDESNPPCMWPFCDPSVDGCPCAENDYLVSITPGFYDFHAVYEVLGKSIPKDYLVLADLVDPRLRRKGLERLCALLSSFGVAATPSQLEVHFESPVNAQRGRGRGGFSREDLDEADLIRVRQFAQEYYRSSNQKLAGEFAEFSAYLDLV